MFSLINRQCSDCIPKHYHEMTDKAALALDTLTAIALLVIGSLILSGTIHLSPTSANIMLPLAGLQGSILIWNCLDDLLHLVRDACCPREIYEPIFFEK